METKTETNKITGAIVTGVIAGAIGALFGVAGSVYVLGERAAKLETEVEHIKGLQSEFRESLARVDEQIKNLEIITTLKNEMEHLKKQIGSLSNKVEDHGKQITMLIPQMAHVQQDIEEVPQDIEEVQQKIARVPQEPVSPGAWANKIKFSSPDGKYGVVTVGEGNDRHFEVRETETGRIVLSTHAQYSTPNEVKTGTFSADSKKFAAAYHYGHEGGYTWIGIWDIESGSLLSSDKKSGWTTDVHSVFDKEEN